MTYKQRDLERVSRQVTATLEQEIVKAGIFYRIFSRCKASDSLNKKLNAKMEDGSPKYIKGVKLLRDIIGIRINLYFVDDLELLTYYFKTLFKDQFVEETIDENNTTEFKPTRVNIIFKIPDTFIPEFKEVIADNRVDSTFELQLRTVFSEGWHEVEHDLRYKCKNDWDEYGELSRTFNGVLAALETHDWSMIQLFERLSYLHYKNENLSAMIRTKLRIRFTDINVSSQLLMQIDETLQKEIFKLDRRTIINLLLNNEPFFPLTIDNVIFMINYFFLKNEGIISITPTLLIEQFKNFNSLMTGEMIGRY